MIEKETLFVLGAGAGVPYKFPDAQGLRDSIINNSYRKYAELDTQFSTGGGIEVFNNWDNDNFNKFTREFLYFVNPSIDLFLAMHPEYVSIGKAAIVLALNEREENYSKIIRNQTNTYDWMEHLYSNFLIKGITNNKVEEVQKFKRNRVSFITFNYDRSLEYFLWTALNSLTKVINREEVGELYSVIKIYHMYGDLGLFNDVINGERRSNPFGGIKHIGQLDYISQNIKTIHERDALPNQDEVVEMFTKAERIYFMGFGFAEENIKALHLEKVKFDQKKIYLTGKGLEDKIKGILPLTTPSFHTRVQSYLTHIVQNNFATTDCLNMIKNFL